MANPAAKGEFERIAAYFAPLARDFPGAFGLIDDAAVLSPGTGKDLVVTTDTIVSGVHFVGDEPPDLIARKLLRVNLSDLAAKGAKPLGYTLNIALPSAVDDLWVEAFATGLRKDQTEFGIHLVGGDSVSTKGTLTLTVTAFGTVSAGRMIRRSTACVGDAVFVTGSIGDAALGLACLQQRLAPPSRKDADFLIDRYRVPRPRTGVGQALLGVAHAAADISDGLVGDLEHITDASGVGAVIESGSVPLSPAAAAALAAEPQLLPTVLTGGDDYELVFTTADSFAVERVARETGVPITRIGWIRAGRGVVVNGGSGEEMTLASRGFRHA